MATQKGQMVFVEVNIEVRKVKIDNREPINMMHKQMRHALLYHEGHLSVFRFYFTRSMILCLMPRSMILCLMQLSLYPCCGITQSINMLSKYYLSYLLIFLWCVVFKIHATVNYY